MKLVNPEGIFPVSIKNVTPKGGKTVLFVWKFVGLVWFDKRFINKVYSVTPGSVHILGFRFTSGHIYEGMCYMSPADKKILSNFKAN